MTLQEAIGLVRREVDSWGEYSWYDFDDFDDDVAGAIATILNAVVKGELNHEK